MVAPLRAGSEVIGLQPGIGRAGRLRAGGSGAGDDLASQAAVAIERTRLHAEVLETRRLEERALHRGSGSRRRSFRSATPRCRTSNSRAPTTPRASWAGITTTTCGSPRGTWGIVVADVSGKGIPAALIMAAFRASLIADGTEQLRHPDGLHQGEPPSSGRAPRSSAS